MSASSGRKNMLIWRGVVKMIIIILHKCPRMIGSTSLLICCLCMFSCYYFIYSMSFVFGLYLNHRDIQLTEERIVVCRWRQIKDSLVVVIISWFVTATISFVSVIISFVTLLIRTGFRISTSFDVRRTISLVEIAATIVVCVILVKYTKLHYCWRWLFLKWLLYLLLLLQL